MFRHLSLLAKAFISRNVVHGAKNVSGTDERRGISNLVICKGGGVEPSTICNLIFPFALCVLFLNHFSELVL